MIFLNKCIENKSICVLHVTGIAFCVNMFHKKISLYDVITDDSNEVLCRDSCDLSRKVFDWGE